MMLLQRWLGFTGALIAIAVVAPSAFVAQSAFAETITATDPIAEFATSSGVVTSYETGGASGDATVLPGSSFGSTSRMHVELQLDGPETSFTFGTPFVGTPDAVPDIYILEDGNPMPLLTADILSTQVTNMVGGAAGQTLTSVTLGGLLAGQSDVLITGGSLAPLFESAARISILLNSPSEPFGFGSTFDLDFTAQMNVQLELTAAVPEPGTFTLMSGALIGLLTWQRRRSR